MKVEPAQITSNEAQTGQGQSDLGSSADNQEDLFPWPQDEMEVAAWVGKRRREAEQHLAHWYNQARIDFQFYEGQQWAQEDREKIEGENRIPVTFNRVQPVIDAICGQEVSNRQEVKYLPRRVGEVTGADPMDDAVKWARDQCNAEDEDSDAFRDMTICGMGWTVARMDYDGNPEGQPDVMRRDPFLMRWDPSARRKNLADARWVQADYWLPREDIEARWPGIDVEGLLSVSAPDDRQQPHDATEAWKYKNDAAGFDRYAGQFRIVHHVERFSLTGQKLTDPATGQTHLLTTEQYKNVRETAEQAGVSPPEAIAISRRVFWEAWTLGGNVLASGAAPMQTESPYQCMTCKRERETGYWFGVVRMMLDPQRYANKLMSMMMSILATGAKGGWVYETGTFANPRKAKADLPRWDSLIEVNKGMLERLKQKDVVQLPTGAAELMQFAVSSIRDVTGVNVDMLGLADRDQPGIVENLRTKAGLTILAPVFDAIRLYRKQQAPLFAEMIRKFISDGRLIRIMGPNGHQFIPLLRDKFAMDYDIVVDESPASRDVKERTWVVLRELVPAAMQAGLPVPQELLDYAPLPDSLVLSWKQQIAKQKQSPPQPPPQIQLEQIKQQGAMALENARHQNKMQETQAEVQAKAASDASEAAQEIRVTQAHSKAELAELGVQHHLNVRFAALEQLINSLGQRLADKAPPPRAAAPAPVPVKQGPDPMHHMAKAMIDAVGQLSGHIAESKKVTLAAHKAATAPKRIIRDKDGRAIGVESFTRRKSDDGE